MTPYIPLALSWGAILGSLAVRPKAPSRVAGLRPPPLVSVFGAQPHTTRAIGTRALNRIGALARLVVARSVARLAPRASLWIGRRLEKVGSHTLIDDRTIGLALLVAVVVAMIHPALGGFVVAVVFGVRIVGPKFHVRRAAARKLEAVERSTPLLIDVLRSGVASGIPTRAVLCSLQVESTVDDLATFNDALGSLRRSLRAGVGYVDALDAFKAEGSAVVGLVAALQATEHYGVGISPALDALAIEARLVYRRRLEIRARRLPVLLLFPLVVFILPAFLILTVVPLLVSGLSSIQW